MEDVLRAELVEHIRTVANWPQPGVQFRDVLPLFANPRVFRLVTDALAREATQRQAGVVAAIDARGFIVGGAMALEMGVGMVPIRKQGKLPGQTIAETYALEYGSATIEVHTEAITAGDRVVLIDDLIATGGTMMAAVRLIERLDAHIVGAAAIIDLPELGGSDLLRDAGIDVFSLVTTSDL